MVRLAVVFYAALLLAAALLGALGGRDVSVLGDSPVFGLYSGAATACSTVVLGVVLYRLLPVLRVISEELAPLLVDGARVRDLMVVSVMSGVGGRGGLFVRRSVRMDGGDSGPDDRPRFAQCSYAALVEVVPPKAVRPARR